MMILVVTLKFVLMAPLAASTVVSALCTSLLIPDMIYRIYQKFATIPAVHILMSSTHVT